MYARWASFAIGLALMLAPLVLGYGSAARILHEVAMGVLVCVATLAALEWPIARFAAAFPAAWLVVAGHLIDFGSALVTTNQVVSGAAALVLALVPSARVATARPVKMAA